MTRLNISGSENVEGTDVSQTLRLFMDKLSESYRFVWQGPSRSARHSEWVVFINTRGLLLTGVPRNDARSAAWRRPTSCWDNFQTSLSAGWRRTTTSCCWSDSSSPCSCTRSASPQPVARRTRLVPQPRLLAARCPLRAATRSSPPVHLSLTDVAAFGRGQPPAGLWWN